jgi:RNA polymerase sigma factor (sigma-70 family)
MVMAMDEIEVRELDVDRSTPITFSDLYNEQFVPLVRLATLLTSNREIARDVVQDAFVKLHVRWTSVRNPLAYVRRSVVNGCKSHHRRKGRTRTIEVADEHSVRLDVDDTLATLDSLNHRQRSVIVLKFYEDRSEKEIADIVGCRPGSVGPTLQRALQKLREVQS